MAIIEGSSAKRTAPGTYLVGGCFHAPWHNKRMMNSVFSLIEKEGIKLQGVVLAGDFLDMNSLSSHDKGKLPLPGVKLGWEYKEASKLIREIESLPFAKKPTFDYIYGNHEDRWFRETRHVDSSKISDLILTPDEGLDLGEHWTVHEDWQQDFVTLGNHLDICHGNFTNVHSAKKHLDVFRTSVMFFHTHRYQIYTEGMHGAFNGGMCGDLTSKVFGYASRAMVKSWMNNIFLVHIDKQGYYIVQPLNYINNSLVVNGRRY